MSAAPSCILVWCPGCQAGDSWHIMARILSACASHSHPEKSCPASGCVPGSYTGLPNSLLTPGGPPSPGPVGAIFLGKAEAQCQASSRMPGAGRTVAACVTSPVSSRYLAIPPGCGKPAREGCKVREARQGAGQTLSSSEEAVPAYSQNHTLAPQSAPFSKQNPMNLGSATFTRMLSTQ